MREIKFRAWDLRNNKWFHQDLFIMTNAGFYPDFREFDDGQSLWDHEFELMQYTGLKDKNGVEIYEGDICKLGYALSVVEYQVSQFVLKQNTAELYPNILSFEAYKNTVSEEVIGNIYENPELLEVAE